MILHHNDVLKTQEKANERFATKDEVNAATTRIQALESARGTGKENSKVLREIIPMVIALLALAIAYFKN